MIYEIFNNAFQLLKITISTEVLWIIFPLILSTIVMLIYFERYRDENPGWNTYVANSLVLLFVSLYLFKHIYEINNLGIINYINYPDKFFLSAFILVFGIVLLFMNFKHFLPEKIAKHTSSPLTINILAYVLIARVYSNIKCSLTLFISMLLLFLLLIIILNLIKIPIQKLFEKLKKMKEQEKREFIIKEKEDLVNKKKEITQEHKIIEQKKKQLTKEEIKAKKQRMQELDKQKKEAIKLKKIINKPSSKKKSSKDRKK